MMTTAGPVSPARRLDPWPLEDREPAAVGPRRHLLRRPLPRPHRHPILRLAGHTGIACALRFMARDPRVPPDHRHRRCPRRFPRLPAPRAIRDPSIQPRVTDQRRKRAPPAEAEPAEPRRGPTPAGSDRLRRTVLRPVSRSEPTDSRQRRVGRDLALFASTNRWRSNCRCEVSTLAESWKFMHDCA